MEDLPHGEWTDIRYNYLAEEKPELLAALRESGELVAHLQEIEERYGGKLWDLMEKQMEREGVDEALKARDPIEWVGRVNNIRVAVKEQLIHEICQ